MSADSRTGSINQGARSLDPVVAQWTREPDPLLLSTKLYRPSLGPALAQRTRLLEYLERNRHRPLTLISAPAGYGKTTLASMWLDTCDCPSAWVSLDEGDNDLRSFSSYLLAALHTAFPTLELRTRHFLETSTLPPAQVLARYLLSDMEQAPKPFVLALDDIHLVRERAIFDLLTELLRHPLPGMHLVLIGRRDPALPIASLRARVQVTEIRARDLRFAPSETAQLLGQMLDRDVDSEIAAEWTEKTEGWVTALRLAALSLRHRDPTDDLGIGVLGGSQYVGEYLFADVLAHLAPAKVEWLLKTSLLEAFCAPLCEAVCRAEGPGEMRKQISEGIELSGKVFVRWLQDENLFLVSLDDQGRWFRLHHLFRSLLQDALRDQLAANEIAGLCLRASNWCAENDLLEEAIRYALAGKDIAAAVQLVVRHRYTLMNTEQWHRLELWLKLLPSDTVAQNALLLSTRAFLAVYRGEERELITARQQAVLLLARPMPEGMPPPQPQELGAAQGEVAVLQGFERFYLGQARGAVASARKGLELLPMQAGHIRSMAHCVLADGLQMQGEVDQAVSSIKEALRDPAWPAVLRARVLHGLSIVYFFEGDLAGVLEAASECLQIATEFQLPESMSYGRYDLGVVHYLRNEFAQAEPYLLALLADRALSTPTYLAFGVFALALMYHSQGRGSEAMQLIELVSTHLQERAHTVAQTITRAFSVELAIRQGRVAEACHLSENVDFDIRPPRWYFYVPQLTRCKLLLAQGTAESLAEALVRLDTLEEEMRKINRNHIRIDALALLALVYRALGEEETALRQLSTAIHLGTRGGFIRNFVDLGPPMADLLGRLQRQEGVLQSSSLLYLTQILAAFPAGDQAGPPPAPGTSRPALDYGEGALPFPAPLVEPLTRRELEILKLLATELYPQEMASELFLSVTTVRTHIRNIYAKFDVHSRFEAIHRARELGLL